MRILHLCLSCFYIDGYNYQENVLPRLNKRDGHDVLILASTETFINNNQLGYVNPSEYVTEYGVQIKRLAYRKIINQCLSAKLRSYPKLYSELEAFAPDVIMSHDLACFAALDVVRYMKKHPHVRLYADTHTADYNSGKNWISLNILHRKIYRYCIQKVLPYVNRYFYVGHSEKEFSQKNYGVPETKMEFYPLGGNLMDVETYAKNREKYRKALSINPEKLLFVHSGKLDSLKKTEDLLKAFSAVPELEALLVIIGSIPESMQPILCPLIEADRRVVYLGWKSSAELQEYLCACDLYLQPGSVSATLQNAICCGCAVLAYPHDNYKAYGYDCFIWVEDKKAIESAFKKLADKEYDIDMLRKNADACARNLLNYDVLVKKLYEQR